MADITMDVNEVLELDYLVQDRSPDSISVKTDSSEYDLTGFEKQVGVFEPNRTGSFTIDVNGQIYEIKVVDIPDSVVDNFEDGDLTEYTNSGNFTLIQSDTYEGSYAIERSSTSYGPMYSTSGLNSYPDQGEKFRCAVKIVDTSGNQDARLRYGLSDNSNHYKAVVSNGNSISLRKQSGGETTLASNSVTVPTSEWLTFDIEWTTNGGHTFTLLDSTETQIGRVTASDSTFADGGVGFNANGNVRFDYYRVRRQL